MANVLFIGAHPDDVELGCGGTIINHLNRKDEVFILILSGGENGQNGKKVNRINESIKALHSVGGVKKSNIFCLNIPDTNFPKKRREIFKKIENLCKIKKIDRVYTHTNKEYHQDHIVVHEETLRAARGVKDILMYESNAHTYSSFSPNFFVKVEDIDKKLTLLSFFKSQLDKDYLEVQNIKSLAKMRGYQGKNTYSEGFEVFRIVAK